MLGKNTTATRYVSSSPNVITIDPSRRFFTALPPRTKSPSLPAVDARMTGHAANLELRGQLGVRAWAVWRYLLRHRDVRGHTTQANAEIVAFCRIEGMPLTLRQVRAACQRLKATGLLAHVRKRPAPWLSNDPRGRRAWIVTRAVYGDYRENVVSLPYAAAKAVAELPKRGGKRPGAGRPRSIFFQPNVNQETRGYEMTKGTVLPNQSGHLGKSNRAGSEGRSKEGEISDTPYQRCTPLGETTSGVQIASLSQIGSREEKAPTPPPATPVGQSAAFDLNERGALTTASFLKQTPPGASNIRPGRFGRDTREREGLPTRRPISAQGARKVAALLSASAARPADVIPPYPSSALLGTPHLPDPPLLTDSMPELDRVERLVRAYNGAVESRWPQLGRSFILARADLRKSKYWHELKDAAEELLDWEIAPASWAQFACDVWINYKKGIKRPPPISFVFGPRFIRDRRGWFLRESGYGGGLAIFSDLHRDVMRRYDGMRRELFRTPAYEGPAAAVARWWPEGWEAIYERIKADYADKRARITRMVAEGQYVW